MPRKTFVIALHLVALGVAVVAPSAAWAQAPDTHTVKPGDTLWSLSQRYLGDPFLWPQIFRLNTDVVEDPHWIYPGEVLRLSTAGQVVSVPTVDTPAPVAPPAAVAEQPDSAPAAVAVDSTPAAEPEAEPEPEPALVSTAPSDDYTPLFPMRGRDQTMKETLRAYTNQPYRPLRRSEFFSSGFLTDRQKLPFGELIGPVLPEQINSHAVIRTALIYTIVAIEPPKGASYQVGDSLLVVQLTNEIPDHGRAVKPTGLLRVTEVADGRTIASVVAVFDRITTGQLLLPAETFTDPGQIRAAPVADGVSATVVGWPKRQEMKTPQQVLFLDKGRADGVAPGDLFEVRRTPGKDENGQVRIADVMAVLQIVHVRDHSATAKVLNVMSPDLQEGASARQVAKLPT